MSMRLQAVFPSTGKDVCLITCLEFFQTGNFEGAKDEMVISEKQEEPVCVCSDSEEDKTKKVGCS